LLVSAQPREDTVIEYAKKKLEQLLDTLIDPVWKRVLKLPWPARLLVLALCLAVGLLASSPHLAKDAYRVPSSLIRAATADVGTIPIDSAVAGRARQTIAKLSSTVEQDLTLERMKNDTPWPIAQVYLALPKASARADNEAIIDFLRTNSEPGCGCWREIPGNAGRPRNIFISGWMLLALSRLDAAATPAELEFLLTARHDDGWWPVFPLDRDLSFGSAYATAWAVIGLQSQFAKSFIDKRQATRVTGAMQAGSVWLLSHREPSAARWKDYPLQRDGIVSESISGVALHALHMWVPNALTQLDKLWLDTLPKLPIPVDEADRVYRYYRTQDGLANDDYVQIKLPWLLVATADAYPSGDLLQRAKALRWLDEALDQRSVQDADTKPENWWRAELLFALRYVLSYP